MRRVGAQQQREGFERLRGFGVPLGRRVGELHHRRDGGVEAHPLRLLRHLRHARVDRLELLLRRGFRADALEEPVRSGEKSRAPLDALRLPHLRLLQRAHEHLVQAERVRAVLRDDVVGVHHVPARFAHFVRAASQLDGLVRGEDVPVPLLLHILRRNLDGLEAVRLALGADVVTVRVHERGVLHLAEDHALRDQPLERLLRGHRADVVQHLVPESSVQEVQHRVLRAAHVEVHGHPVLLQAAVHHRVLVLGVDETEVVPARPGPLGHGVGLASRGAAADGIGGLDPIFHVREGTLAAAARLEVIRLREGERELFQRHGDGLVAPLGVHHGEGLAPVPLPRKEPISKLEVHLLRADTLRLEPLRHLRARLDVIHPVHVQRIARAVDHLPGAGVARALFRALRRLHHLHHGKSELRRKLEVSVVVRGHSHDGARAVRPEHVIRHPHGHVLARQRVCSVRAREHARLLLGEFGALQVRLSRRREHVLLHGFLLFVRGERVHERVLRGDDEVGGAEEGVRPGGVHLERAVHARDVEGELRALGSTDPVSLHLLDGLGPVEVVEVVEQAVAVRGDLEHPLLHGFANHRVAAALGDAVHHLLVGQHRAERGAPVHGNLRLIRETALEELQEDPLRPLEIRRIARRHFAVPVVGETERLELFAEAADVDGGGVAGMGARLDGVLLRGESERVPAHGVENVVAGHALIPRDDVGGGVSLGVAHVKTRAAANGKGARWKSGRGD